MPRSSSQSYENQQSLFGEVAAMGNRDRSAPHRDQSVGEDWDTDARGLNAGSEEASDLAADIPEAELWAQSPRISFLKWKKSLRPLKREFSPHSLEQYEAMFGAYLTWAAEHGVRVLKATSADIERFLDSRIGRNGEPAARTTRRRYLHLLNNVYEHLVEIELRISNPAGHLTELNRHQAFERPAPTILPAPLAEKYIAWVSAQPQEHWCEVRDKALRLLFLASGISVLELQGLRISDVRGGTGQVPMTLNILPHNFIDAHATPVAAFAQPILLAWIELLGQRWPLAGRPDDHVFPARYFGFGIDRPDAAAVSSVECYLIVQSAMKAIGYEHARQGPQTLRNSFIARQVAEGTPQLRITQWLGLRTLETVQRVTKMVPVRHDGVKVI